MTSDTRLRLAKYGSTRMQLIVALLFGNLMVTACSSNPRVKLPPLDPRKAGKLAISLHDANGDGGISDDELKSCPGLLASMDTVDSDGDHRLTAEEITDRLEKQRDTGLAYTTVSCMVFYQRRPLANASIRFVPEKFLGEGIKVATGTTNERGSTILKIPASKYPGIHCGFYRVEISQRNPAGDELIPAKYNVSTNLGQEVSQRIPREGIVQIHLR